MKFKNYVDWRERGRIMIIRGKILKVILALLLGTVLFLYTISDWAAVTKCHRLCAFNNGLFSHSYWRLEVQAQGDSVFDF